MPLLKAIYESLGSTTSTSNEHRDKVEAQEHVELKMAYFQGVLDAQILIGRAIHRHATETQVSRVPEARIV